MYIIIDTEATGLNPFKCGLIQLAGVIMNNQLEIIDQFCADIKPTELIQVNQEALEVNGFTLERIEQGESEDVICDSFLDFLRKNKDESKYIMVGQFLPFDYSFLWKLFSDNDKLEQLFEYIGNDFIDTKSIVNQANLQAKLEQKKEPYPVTSLSKKGGLKYVLGIDSSKYKAHDALGDCLATRDVLIQIIKT